jgi:hypothetical protein
MAILIFSLETIFFVQMVPIQNLAQVTKKWENKNFQSKPMNRKKDILQTIFFSFCLSQQKDRIILFY